MARSTRTMTAEERQIVAGRAYGSVVIAVGGVLFCLGAVATTWSTPGAPLAIGFGAIVAVGMVAYAARLASQLRGALADGVVEVVEGPVTSRRLHARGRQWERRMRYFLTVGGTEYEVDRAPYDTRPDGASVRVVVVPGGGPVVSITSA